MIDFEQLQSILLAGKSPASGSTLVPAGMTLERLEQFQEYPDRFRGTYQTGHLTHFMDYLEHYGAGGCDAHAFIDDSQPAPVVHAILDHGTQEDPRWRQHTAILSVAPTFAALSGLIGKPIGQKTMIDFLDDWGDHCAFTRPDGASAPLDVARAEFANLTLETVRKLNSQRGDFTRQLSEVERLSLGSGLPNRLTFTAAPWRDFSTHDLRLRLTAADNGSGIALELRHIAWDTTRNALLGELTEKLSTLPTLSVRLGRFN